MLYKCKGIIFDDAVLKKESGDVNDYTSVCIPCVRKHKISWSKLDGIGSEYCGVKGCTNRANYYLDFEDGELEVI
ncbi:hypothetical protein SAMN05446037_1006141 [Anaerovirgula multivorans]|uniref:Uncharacterized protein n=1 Tax=Anaerovirgula multivorans TaxID=312168 RepID=A0A239CU19_9FIRM|nr:hypothetical protein [Anaerovirgula multivorans]SNS23352.1 hypothetical protein SAMN05446037_1006141 [Anaerovirgula multivorans]